MTPLQIENLLCAFGYLLFGGFLVVSWEDGRGAPLGWILILVSFFLFTMIIGGFNSDKKAWNEDIKNGRNPRQTASKEDWIWLKETIFKKEIK